MSEVGKATERATTAFREADKALKDFMADPAVRDVLQEYTQLVNQYNQCLEDAVRSVKSELRRGDQEKIIIGGIGAQRKFRTWYDAEMLVTLLPASQTEEIITEKITYELDEQRLEQLCRQGEIDNEVVRRAYHREELNPANLPGTPKPFYIPPLPVNE